MIFFDKQTNLTVEEYMTKWLNTVKKPTVKRSSFDRIELTLKHQIFPAIGSIKMKKLKSEDIQLMLNDIAETRSYSTTKKAYINIKSCLELAEVREDIKNNPIRTVVLPRNTDPKETVVYYSPEQAKAISEVAVSTFKNGKLRYRYGYFIILLLNTGMRLGEALALTWNDVDFNERMIHIHHSLSVVKSRNGGKTTYETIVQTPKSKKSIRFIPLNDRAYAALVKLYANEDFSGEKVICTESGNYVDPRRIRKTMYSILESCGIYGKKDVVHALRHTFATLLIRQGVDIKVVSELLGHSDITITMQYYYHIIEEQKKNAIIKLNDIY